MHTVVFVPWLYVYACYNMIMQSFQFKQMQWYRCSSIIVLWDHEERQLVQRLETQLLQLVLLQGKNGK